MQIILWILGAVATYRLWESTLWLSIVTIILVLSYSVWPDEKKEHATTGMYSNVTASRLMWIFILVLIIFIYSLIV